MRCGVRTPILSRAVRRRRQRARVDPTVGVERPRTDRCVTHLTELDGASVRCVFLSDSARTGLARALARAAAFARARARSAVRGLLVARDGFRRAAAGEPAAARQGQLLRQGDGLRALQVVRVQGEGRRRVAARQGGRRLDELAVADAAGRVPSEEKATNRMNTTPTGESYLGGRRSDTSNEHNDDRRVTSTFSSVLRRVPPVRFLLGATTLFLSFGRNQPEQPAEVRQPPRGSRLPRPRDA